MHINQPIGVDIGLVEAADRHAGRRGQLQLPMGRAGGHAVYQISPMGTAIQEFAGCYGVCSAFGDCTASIIDNRWTADEAGNPVFLDALVENRSHVYPASVIFEFPVATQGSAAGNVVAGRDIQTGQIP